MEKLTERISDGILVKEDYGENALKTLCQCYGAEPMSHYANCEEGYCAMEKLTEYEDLEEQGKLLKLPVAVGDTVYVIPSETNYKLNIINGYSENNRVYEQILNRIEITKTGYLFVTCDGMASVVDAFYKKTWFLTKEEAEAALKELERSKGK